MSDMYDFTGCCGASIIYGFSYPPSSTKRYVIDPKTGTYAFGPDGKMKVAVTHGQHFEEILAKKRQEMPNRLYCSILNDSQCQLEDGAWLKILKKHGFEFVRSWSNSNHDGSFYGGMAKTSHPLYLFVLCTDDKGTYKDHNRPPPGWNEL